METMKVKHPDGGVMIINAEDFDKEIHKELTKAELDKIERGQNTARGHQGAGTSDAE